MTSGFDPAIFDAAALDQRTGGDAALRQEIIGMFLEDCPTHLSSIRAAVAAGDAATLRRAAHRFKGAAAYLSGTVVAQAASDLEAAGRDGRISEAPAHLLRLESAVAALLPYLS